MPSKTPPSAPPVSMSPQVKAILDDNPDAAIGPAIVKRFDRFNDVLDIDFDGSIDNETLISAMEEKLHLALQYMSPDKMQDANLATLVKFFGILLDRRQLLKGEPTQIVSNQDRRALNDLLPSLMEEAKRRGMTVPVIEGEMEVIENG